MKVSTIFTHLHCRLVMDTDTAAPMNAQLLHVSSPVSAETSGVILALSKIEFWLHLICSSTRFLPLETHASISKILNLYACH